MKGKTVAIISVSILALGGLAGYLFYLYKINNTDKIEDVGFDIYVKQDEE